MANQPPTLDRILYLLEQDRIDQATANRMMDQLEETQPPPAAQPQAQQRQERPVPAVQQTRASMGELFRKAAEREEELAVEEAFNALAKKAGAQSARARNPLLFNALEEPVVIEETPTPTTRKEWREVVVGTKRGRWGREEDVLEWMLVDVPNTPQPQHGTNNPGQLLLPPPPRS
jgi:hypothetical protein